MPNAVEAHRSWLCRIGNEFKSHRPQNTDPPLISFSRSQCDLSAMDSVWSIATKDRVGFLAARKRTTWKWFVGPSTPSQLLLLEDNVLRLSDGAGLSQLPHSQAHVLPAEVTSRASDSPRDLTDRISIYSEGDELDFVQKSQPSARAFHEIPRHIDRHHQDTCSYHISLGDYNV